jgi:hypothetical protein
MKKTSKKQLKGRKANYHPIPRPISLAPPPYVSQENRSWIVRYYLTAANTNVSIQMNHLAGALGIVATGTTTSVFLCDQFRLRRMCIWGPVQTAGTPVFVTLKYADDPNGTNSSGPPKTVSDSSVSFDRPAYACLEPPKGNTSVFSQWMDSSATTVVVICTGPIGAIIDFHLNFIVDDIGSTSGGPTIVAGAAGTIYHKAFGNFTVAPPLNSI